MAFWRFLFLLFFSLHNGVLLESRLSVSPKLLICFLRISYGYPCTNTLLCRPLLLACRLVFIPPPFFLPHRLSCKPEIKLYAANVLHVERCVERQFYSHTHTNVAKRHKTTTNQKKLVNFSQWSCIFISKDLFAESNQKGKRRSRSWLGVIVRFLLSVLLAQYDCMEPASSILASVSYSQRSLQPQLITANLIETKIFISLRPCAMSRASTNV